MFSPGIPERIEQHGVTFPNRLILAGLFGSLLTCTDSNQNQQNSVNDIRATIEIGLKDRALVRKAHGYTLVRRTEKISIRRMMSRYWDNSSSFALDLVGAVIRQGSFIEKMHAIDWIHSPAVAATMARLMTKYSRYFDILEKYPSHMAVPTLDVDLAW